MASKRAVRRRQCGVKHKYTKEQAMERATDMTRWKKVETFDAYPCACGSWHIGHRPSHVQAQITKRRRSA